jgi:hypothetical protein
MLTLNAALPIILCLALRTTRIASVFRASLAGSGPDRQMKSMI